MCADQYYRPMSRVINSVCIFIYQSERLSAPLHLHGREIVRCIRVMLFHRVLDEVRESLGVLFGWLARDVAAAAERPEEEGLRALLPPERRVSGPGVRYSGIKPAGRSHSSRGAHPYSASASMMQMYCSSAAPSSTTCHGPPAEIPMR